MIDIIPFRQRLPIEISKILNFSWTERIEKYISFIDEFNSEIGWEQLIRILCGVDCFEQETDIECLFVLYLKIKQYGYQFQPDNKIVKTIIEAGIWDYNYEIYTDFINQGIDYSDNKTPVLLRLINSVTNNECDQVISCINEAHREHTKIRYHTLLKLSSFFIRHGRIEYANKLMLLQ